ncbi:MAG: class I SAM-dependent methyltransferase [Candidatus Tenebribacter davisii]|jgi:SAM-dependent methyltransferase|nr:class I SAM-dependent methyltransferase [Candidatus Tenebribacter davisii]
MNEVIKTVNTYKTTAKYYDSDNKDLLKDDIDFYLKYADELKGNVLEIGCGTGRITIPLARAEHKVWGLDVSQPMLEILVEKLKSESETTVINLNVLSGDMRNFSLNEKFKLIFIPFRTFQSLITDKDQYDCLQCCQNHLEDDGLFIVNVFKLLEGHLDESWVQPEKIDYETTKNGITVKRTHIRERVDLKNQVIYPTLIYYVTEDGKTEKFYEYLAMKYYYVDQLRELMQQNGFEVINEFGYYNKCSMEDGGEIIFVCRKKSIN